MKPSRCNGVTDQRKKPTSDQNTIKEGAEVHGTQQPSHIAGKPWPEPACYDSARLAKPAGLSELAGRSLSAALMWRLHAPWSLPASECPTFG